MLVVVVGAAKTSPRSATRLDVTRAVNRVSRRQRRLRCRPSFGAVTFIGRALDTLLPRGRSHRRQVSRVLKQLRVRRPQRLFFFWPLPSLLPTHLKNFSFFETFEKSYQLEVTPKERGARWRLAESRISLETQKAQKSTFFSFWRSVKRQQTTSTTTSEAAAAAPPPKS